jgi:8-oxo-dGTP pyrophosphatase MutT (NUDIX family)
VAKDAPAPGEELNPGAPTPARPAASVILLRDSAAGPEVLLVQRSPKQRFMGGAWVFPGGAVDAGEEPPDAARRELTEEAGVRLPEDAQLETFSRWITPAQVKVRFDTWFFVAAAPPGAEPTPDGGETVGARWIRPADALSAGEEDELELVFPTIKHLEALCAFDSVAGAVQAAAARRVMPVEPRVLTDGGIARVVLPGEPGYDA